jgi:phosphate transport system substrate-binding protein
VANALVAGFQARHPQVHWQVIDVGSRAGMRLLHDGGADLAMSSVEPEATDTELTLLTLGITGIGIAVHANNPLRSLTREQVRDIFSGTVTDWKAVGAAPGQILVIIRPAEAAVRRGFTRFFFDASTAFAKDAIVLSDLEQTLNLLRSFSKAVAMVRINSATRDDASIRLLAINGVAPSRENIINRVYEAQRPYYLVYASSTMKPAAQAFVDYVQSDEGKATLAAIGP